MERPQRARSELSLSHFKKRPRQHPRKDCCDTQISWEASQSVESSIKSVQPYKDMNKFGVLLHVQCRFPCLERLEGDSKNFTFVEIVK